ncbi:hypothetical protein AVEN_212913-1 [Araneus ventricosus]|uniref:DUF4219 domain-containing protein n=1 Tax=Araneus ventricosus TaxID=182803 RepID=A0A4Y2RI62_ARAVE|nr:hypothetical protein AVEN_212913-1 [Araneus ventricosus]
MDISIEKLNANNYSTWKEDVKVVLMEKAGIEDPVKAWKILEEHFRPDSRARATGLADEFFSCRVCPDEDIGIYASGGGARLKHISAQLADCYKPIQDWYHAFQLIQYLPPDYAGIVQVIYRWKNEDFKADKVLSELLAEEARLKQSNKDQEVLECQAKINSSRPLKVITRKIPSENHDKVELTSKVKGRQRKNQKRRPRSFSRKRQNTSLVTDANASVTTSLPPGSLIQRPHRTSAVTRTRCSTTDLLKEPRYP